MKKVLHLLLLVCFVGPLCAQVPNTDEMMPKIAALKSDSARARLVWDCLGTSETDPILDLEIAGKLLVQSRRLKDPVEEVIALACLGYDYRLIGDNTKSWKYGREAYAISEANPNLEAKAVGALALGQNYQDIGDNAKALSLFKSSIKYGQQCHFDKVQSIAYTILSDFYLMNNKVDSALIFGQLGYELTTRIAYKDYLGGLLQLLGGIHERLGNKELAISYYNLAVQQGKKMKSPKFTNTSYTAKALFYQTQNQPDSVALYAKKAIAAVQNTAFANYGLTPAKLLLDVYKGKNIDSAFKYSEIYREASDSLFNAKTIQQTHLMGFEENLRQKELAVEKQKAEEHNEANIQLSLVALGIVVFIMLFLLLSRSIITNTKIIAFFGVLALLIVFEFLNLLLHPFLEETTHHSPALMLAGLVAIAALLIPLHHRIEHWATHLLVEKNKAIRLAQAKKTIEKLEVKQS